MKSVKKLKYKSTGSGRDFRFIWFDFLYTVISVNRKSSQEINRKDNFIPLHFYN